MITNYKTKIKNEMKYKYFMFLEKTISCKNKDFSLELCNVFIYFQNELLDYYSRNCITENELKQLKHFNEKICNDYNYFLSNYYFDKSMLHTHK